jgi:hypothetical protein
VTSTGSDSDPGWEERLLEQLRQLGRSADPVPDDVVFAARGSFAWRRIDAELAELTFDSLFDEAELAPVRSTDTVRLVTFDAGDITVEVEVTTTGGHRRLIGQLVPPQEAMVEVRAASGPSVVPADRLGRFTVDDLAAGPASLRCRLTASGRVIESGWISI